VPELLVAVGHIVLSYCIWPTWKPTCVQLSRNFKLVGGALQHTIHLSHS